MGSGTVAASVSRATPALAQSGADGKQVEGTSAGEPEREHVVAEVITTRLRHPLDVRREVRTTGDRQGHSLALLRGETLPG